MEIKLYRALEKQKEFSGILKGFDAKTVTIQDGEDERVFERSNIAMIRLALDF